MKRLACLMCVILVITASAARAQSSWDVSLMTGYALPAELDHAARGVASTSIDPGGSWQFAVGRNFNHRWAAEMLWTEQFTGFSIESPNGEAGRLFDMSIMQLHGNLLYQFGASGSRLQPYALVGVGSTFFTAQDLHDEIKFSMGFGAGLKYFVRKEIGVRGQFRYKTHFLNDAQSTDFCDPFGFCQSTLGQFEFAGGVTFRF
jgi:opacity protein-like surface antigen